MSTRAIQITRLIIDSNNEFYLTKRIVGKAGLSMIDFFMNQSEVMTMTRSFVLLIKNMLILKISKLSLLGLKENRVINLKLQTKAYILINRVKAVYLYKTLRNFNKPNSFKQIKSQ